MAVDTGRDGAMVVRHPVRVHAHTGVSGPSVGERLSSGFQWLRMRLTLTIRKYTGRQSPICVNIRVNRSYRESEMENYICQ